MIYVSNEIPQRRYGSYTTPPKCFPAQNAIHNRTKRQRPRRPPTLKQQQTDSSLSASSHTQKTDTAREHTPH